MQIELSNEDALVAREALRRHLGELMDKIAREGGPAARPDLQRAYDQLASIKARLEGALGDALPAGERAA